MSIVIRSLGLLVTGYYDSGMSSHVPAAPEPSGAQARRDLAIALRDLQRAGLAVRHELGRRLRLGTSDVNALDQIVFSAEPLGPVDLGHRLGITSASATALTDRLERAGHLRRVRHPSDRRRQTLTPTDHARAEVTAALRPLIQALDAAADGMSPAETEAVTRYLSRAADAMRGYAHGDAADAAPS